MNGLFAVLGRSLRGMRLVEAFALVMLLVMVLGNYLAKARAGRERGDITAVETQIADEQKRLRLLDAEVAHLEQPGRMELLSAAAGLGPTAAKHEGVVEQLPQIAQGQMIADKSKSAAAAPSEFVPPTGAVVMASAGKPGAPQ